MELTVIEFRQYLQAKMRQLRIAIYSKDWVTADEILTELTSKMI